MYVKDDGEGDTSSPPPIFGSGAVFTVVDGYTCYSDLLDATGSLGAAQFSFGK